jgi:hypothetical protein
MASLDGDFESSCSCAICMEELGTSIESCPCGHVYHKACIRNWIVQKRICPQCKGDALPLINLTFNLFQISAKESKKNITERIGSLNADITAMDLNIETELCEINILEPQLAECQAEEQAYEKGITARRSRKKKLEGAFEKEHQAFLVAEELRKDLTNKLESIRSKISRSNPEFAFESAPSKRAVHGSEIPKFVTFMQADFRKLKDMGKETESLNSRLMSYKSEALSINKAIRDITLPAPVKGVKPLLKSTEARYEGFVPLDALAHKRRRDDDRLRELESRKPNLFDNLQTESRSRNIGLERLSTVVSYLSDNDDIPESEPQMATQPVDPSQPKQESLDNFFRSSAVIVLD